MKNDDSGSGMMATGDGMEAVGYQPRPPRFPIVAPVEYRTRSEGEWHRGTTVNISRSGVLFRGEKCLELKTILEMRILLPADMTGEEGTRIVCWGPVVRHAAPDPADPRPGLATSFLRYRFSHE